MKSQQKDSIFYGSIRSKKMYITALDGENVITSNAKMEVPKSFFGLVVRDYSYGWEGRGFDPGLEQL